MPMIATLILVAPLFAVRLAAQETVAARTLVPYTERVETGFIDWGHGMAEVEVEASYDTVRFGSSHAKIKSLREADEMGDAAMFRLLRGINIHGEQRLAGHPELEEALRRTISKTAKMDVGKIANITLNATISVSLLGGKAVSGTMHKTAFAESDATGILAGTTGSVHTSIVFDASKTSLQAALFPRVLTESGELIFGPGVLDPKALSRGAGVHYVVRVDDSGKKKSGLSKGLAKTMGDNPLVVEVGKIAGEFLADIVLRPEQVELLRQAQAGDLLTQGLVFILQTQSIDTTR